MLNQAHTRGLVHGCLSPCSISLTANGAVVLSPPSHPGANTAPYRSPEQVRGEQPDSRSDIFAFGAILYEMAAGTRAFPHEGPELNRSILQDPSPTLTLRSPIYDPIARVISGCLEKNPAARRQRIQNAVIELRFASRAPGRAAAPPRIPGAASSSRRPVLSAPPNPPTPRTRPLAPPQAEQFFFRPGEAVPRMRAMLPPAGWRAVFMGQ